VRNVVLIFSLLALATPCSATDFDWEKPSNQKMAIGAFNNMAAFCSQLGFTRVPPQPADAMQKKLEAYMLLSSDRNGVLERWGEMLHDWMQFTQAADDKALLDRAADALIAAAKDPDQYDQAEQLYVETVMAPAKVALSSCDWAAADDFVGKHFITGSGSVQNWRPKLKQMFADSVAQTKADLAKQAKPAPTHAHRN
jgi:hypothetical protein